MIHSDQDPIVARATAPGRGGIGIVRVSGQQKDIKALMGGLFPGQELKPRHATLLSVKESDGSDIDRAVILYFEGPHSYTGEDVLEIQAHGGMAVLQMILDRVLELGRSLNLRLADAGEFTQRAFLNGRMDLAQSEAVADLIDAGTAAAARAATRTLQGVFSEKLTQVSDHITELRAYVEATLDFPEEDIDFIADGHIAEQVNAILSELTDLEKKALRGKVLRDGLTVVLVGAPNVGKSSLMNALAQSEVAIVTEIAGTTRDRIEHDINLDGLLVHLIDTAGVRETDDPVEKIGVERTLSAIENADVVLALTDASGAENDDAWARMKITERLRDGIEKINVINKADLKRPLFVVDKTIVLSAKTGEGLEALINNLKSISGKSVENEGDFLARSRHLNCLARARTHLELVQANLKQMTLEIAAEELRLAGNEIGEITGQVLPDDLLGMIFSRFCIGK